MFCGDKVLDTPPLGGKKITHLIEKITAWGVMIIVVVLKGRFVIFAYTLSFTVRIFLSTSRTCSPSAQIFKRTPKVSNELLRLSNSLSVRQSLHAIHES
jgi:hypothetical protein